MRIFLIALLTSLIMSSSVRADPLKDPLPWVGPQILSIINKQNVWTPSDFAIARGDISSVPKLRIAKDVMRKSGATFPGNRVKPNDMSTYTLTNILGIILLWSSDEYWR